MYCLYFRQYRPKEYNQMFAICFNYYSLKALSIPFYAIYSTIRFFLSTNLIERIECNIVLPIPNINLYKFYYIRHLTRPRL